MVIQSEDGEKYACDACVRGHRVSSCTHKDRHLNHINKKGRPVTQCPHCRSLRKQRQTHVKCICAELAQQSHPLDPAHCQCMVTGGAKCSCAHKKDAEPDVSKMTTLNTAAHRRTQSKPAIANRRSDSVVPKYQNGHHPPLHRHNNAAHEYSPYPLKRAQSSTAPMDIAQRSVDSLPLSVNGTRASGTQPFPMASASVPHHSFMNDASLFSSQEPAAFDAQGLVPMSAEAAFLSNAVSPRNPQRYSVNDFSQLDWANASEQYEASMPLSAMSEQPMFNWNDFDFTAPATNPAYTQASSVASIEHPGLSRSSSGSASDTGESAFNASDINLTNMQIPAMPGDNGWLFAGVNVESGNGFGLEPGLAEKTPIGLPPRQSADAQFDDYFGDMVLQNEAAGGGESSGVELATGSPGESVKVHGMWGADDVTFGERTGEAPYEENWL